MNTIMIRFILFFLAFLVALHVMTFLYISKLSEKIRRLNIFVNHLVGEEKEKEWDSSK